MPSTPQRVVRSRPWAGGGGGGGYGVVTASSERSWATAGPDRDRLWQRIADEHDLAVDAVLTVTRSGELLDRHPVLQRTIARRNPFVDALNAAQVGHPCRKINPQWMETDG